SEIPAATPPHPGLSSQAATANQSGRPPPGETVTNASSFIVPAPGLSNRPGAAPSRLTHFVHFTTTLRGRSPAGSGVQIGGIPVVLVHHPRLVQPHQHHV